MKQLKLRTKQFKVYYALVDDEDYARCLVHSWNFVINRTTVATKIGDIRINLANFIMDDFNNQYDHKNRNSLDNQKGNLRICTQTQNTYNKSKTSLINATSQYKGVSWVPKQKYWQARLCINGYTIRLGFFANEADAALAYNKAAIKHFGEFAALNVVDIAKGSKI